jgi:uncharacterized integral membrane protein
VRPVLAVVLVVAGLILVVGALNHAQTVSLDCVVGTWSQASVFVLAAIVAGLLVATAVLAAAAAGVRAADDRRKLENELERTYARLRAAGGQPARRQVRSTWALRVATRRSPEPASGGWSSAAAPAAGRSSSVVARR